MNGPLRAILVLFGVVVGCNCYCLSVSGGGFRAMVGAIAFSKTQHYPNDPVLFAGTSGGAWGSYAVCRHAHFGQLPTPKTGMFGGDAYKLMWKGAVKQVGEGYHYFLTGEPTANSDVAAVRYEQFRKVWWRNLVKVFKDVGVPYVPQVAGFNREAHKACVDKIIVTEGRTVEGANDCDPRTFSYCRNFQRKLRCDEKNGVFSIPTGETFRQAMLTSSSAATTDAALEESMGLVDIAKYKGPLGDLDLPEELDFPQYEFFDVGACDNNPWPELLDFAQECSGQIINLDMSGYEGGQQVDSLAASVNYATTLEWQVTRKHLTTPTGSRFGDKITLSRDSQTVKVLNLNPMSNFKHRMGEEIAWYLPTFPQTYKTEKVLRFVSDIQQSWEHKYVQRALQWLKE